MAVEHQRGISVSSAVMSFEHYGLAFNLLDASVHREFSPLGFQPTGISAHWDFSPLGFQPTGISAHWDFSEDAYRTLTAVDSVVMVLDAAPEGAEGKPQALRKVQGEWHYCLGGSDLRSSIIDGF
jgi:peptide chain release factor 3